MGNFSLDVRVMWDVYRSSLKPPKQLMSHWVDPVIKHVCVGFEIGIITSVFSKFNQLMLLQGKGKQSTPYTNVS